MQALSYGELLKTALAITRHNRYLWFFGLFAGGSASFNFPTNFTPPTGSEQDSLSRDVPSIDPGVIVGLVAVVLLVVVVALSLSLISQGALIDSVAAIDRGGERRFGTAWKSGTRTFWRVLGYVVLLILIALAILLAIGIPVGAIVFGVFSATDSLGLRIGVGIVFGLLALVALLAAFVPLQVIGQLALRHLVLREERPVAALKYGYRMFRAQIGASLLVWLIVLGISFGVAIVILILGLVLGVAVAVPVIALFAAQATVAAIAILIVAAVILIPLFLVLFGAVGTFTHSVWTLAYMRLERDHPLPPLEA